MRAIAWTAVGAFVAASVVGGISAAVGNDTIIYACVHNKAQTIKLTTAVKACPTGYTKISWNTQGPKGETGGTGATGAQGPKGDTGVTGPRGPGKTTVTGLIRYTGPPMPNPVSCLAGPPRRVGTIEAIGSGFEATFTLITSQNGIYYEVVLTFPEGTFGPNGAAVNIVTLNRPPFATQTVVSERTSTVVKFTTDTLLPDDGGCGSRPTPSAEWWFTAIDI